MSIFREIPPTAGFPLILRDFFAASSKQNCLEEDFKLYLNIAYAKITYSGTAAFYIILEGLKELSSKRTVIIPSFVCPLIPLAIKRAGFKVAVCDINNANFSFDKEQLDKICFENKDVLAIVAVHLAGLPIDFDAIKETAQRYKIFIIEDCAQSLGALYKNKLVGTLGEFSFFSLCRGKGLTIYEGGVIATTNGQYSTIIESAIKRIVKNAYLQEGLKILELFGYWIFYRPQLFWFVWRLPQIFWESQGRHFRAMAEYFSIDFPTHEVSGIRKSVGHACFSRLDNEIENQRIKAGIYMDGLRNLKTLKIISQEENTRATYPYVTLIFDEPLKQETAIKKLMSLGLGGSQIYAAAITDYDYLKDIIEDTPCPNARNIAKRHITLSTSSFLKPDDTKLLINTVKQL